MRPHLYILDDKGEPVALPCSGGMDAQSDEALIKWGKFFEKKDLRRVAYEDVNGVKVSTVFLGMDHSFNPEGPAILWETMCFAEGCQDGHPMDGEQDRCAGGREQAEAMHQEMVERVKRFSSKEG